MKHIYCNLVSFFLVVEEALKTFLSISLSEDQLQSLAGNLGLSAAARVQVQRNLGKIVLYWMGNSGSWEVGELVEALVCTESLGRHTTVLCNEQGMCGRGRGGLGVYILLGREQGM